MLIDQLSSYAYIPFFTESQQIETVERLQRRVRDYRAGYNQTINVLKHAKSAAASSRAALGKSPLITKTSLMLGLGEEPEDIRSLLRDLRAADVDVITFGQYLRPSRRHISVVRYVPPEEFTAWQTEAEQMGFKYVASGPMVRSSYKAGEFFLKGMIENSNNEIMNQNNSQQHISI